MTIYLDSQNAIYDTSIKELRFYNHKLITGNVSITGWWKNDNLKEENGRFVLTIDIGTMHHDCILQFSFETCRVIHGTLLVKTGDGFHDPKLDDRQNKPKPRGKLSKKVIIYPKNCLPRNRCI